MKHSHPIASARTRDGRVVAWFGGAEVFVVDPSVSETTRIPLLRIPSQREAYRVLAIVVRDADAQPTPRRIHA